MISPPPPNELRDLALRQREADRAEVQDRLDLGEEVPLEAALDLIGWPRPQDSLHGLCAFEAHGRRGSPCAAETAIPRSAWLHLRWTARNFDIIVIEPDSTAIYDVRLRLPSLAAKGAGEVTDQSPALPAAGADASIDVATVFENIVRAGRESAVPLPIETCQQHLAMAGLRMSESGRVHGVRIGTGGGIEAGAGGGGVQIGKILLFAWLKADPPKSDTFTTRRALVRELVRRVVAHHGILPGMASLATADDTRLDRMIFEMRACGAL